MYIQLKETIIQKEFVTSYIIANVLQVTICNLEGAML